MATINQYNEYYEAYKRKFPPKATLSFSRGAFWTIFIVLLIFGLGIGAIILLIIASYYQTYYNHRADAWASYQLELHKGE